jgi:hypothetical protein
MFLEDHTGSIVFRTVEASSAHELQIGAGEASPETSSFFVAVCGRTLVEPRTFVYLPEASNMLRDKLEHIRRLEGEIRTKDAWMAQEQAAHQQLLAKHGEQLAELEKSNRWGLQLQAALESARKRIVSLHQELEQTHARAREAIAGYEKHIAELNATLAERTQWAHDTEHRLTGDLAACVADRDRQTAELARCVDILHETEGLLEERTRWAMSLNEEKDRLDAALSAARASRWIRLGRAVGLGPELQGN